MAAYGAAWASVVTGNGANATLFSVWGSGRNDVWAAGASGMVMHWDGKTWTRQATLVRFAGWVIATHV